MRSIRHPARHVAFVFIAVGSLACAAALGSVACGAPDEVGAKPVENVEGGPGEVPPMLAVTPAEARIGALRPQKFAASEDVTWSVEEPAGGTIDATGRYASPEIPGVYHVVATNKADPTKTAKVTVTVVPLGLSILVGKPGGPGNLNGTPDVARFASPGGVAYSWNGGSTELTIIADTGNDTIRRYDHTSNTVTTLAGASGVKGTADGVGTAARFDTPTIVVANEQKPDAAWVVDSKNHCVRRVDVLTGAVTTLAGSCGTSGNQDSTDDTGATARFQDIRAMVLGPAKDALYLCHGVNGPSVRRVDLVTGKTTTTVSAISPSCNMASDAYRGFVYFTDRNGFNTKLQRFADVPGGPGLNPALTTVVTFTTGKPFAAMTAHTGALVQNELYLTSADNEPLIYRYAIPDAGLGIGGTLEPYSGAQFEYGTVNGTPDAARYSSPNALTAIPSRNFMYVADATGHVVRRIDFSKNQVSTALGVAPNTEAIDGPRADARLLVPLSLAGDDLGNLVIAEITRLGTVVRRFDAAAATLTRLSGGAMPDGGSYTPADGPQDQSRLGIPADMVRVGGDVFVLDGTGAAIRKVSLATGSVTTIAGELNVPGKSDGVGVAAHFSAINFVDPARDSVIQGGIATDGTDLYVADAGNFAIRKVTLATGAVTTLAGGTKGKANGVGPAAQFSKPGGVAFFGGSLYVSDVEDSVIRRLDLATNEVTSFIGLAGQAGSVNGDASVATLSKPFRLVADGIGNLYVSEALDRVATGTLRRVDIERRTISVFAGAPGLRGLTAGPLPATLNVPTGLFVNAKGDLVFVDADGVIAIIQPL
jgi:sugar lactone lactonase YvrE